MPTTDEFFAGHDEAHAIFGPLAAMVAGLGDSEMRVTKSQVGFYRKRPFAAAWIPASYLRRPGAPLVLTVYLHRRDGSPRWKEVVEPAAGRFTHHLELRSPGDVDAQVAEWLAEAYAEAAESVR